MKAKRGDTINSVVEKILVILLDHVGEAKKINRRDLLKMINENADTPIKDRRMRDLIEWSRGHHPAGAFICSNTSGGYWYAETRGELDSHLRQDSARVKKMSHRISQQRKAASPILSGNIPLGDYYYQILNVHPQEEERFTLVPERCENMNGAEKDYRLLSSLTTTL